MPRRSRNLLTRLVRLSRPPGVTARPSLEVGQRAPSFNLPDQHGTIVGLADFRGRWLVLYFYPKDFTPGCLTQAQHLRDVLPQIQHLEAEIVGISEDSVQSHARFDRTHHLNYTLLADDRGKVAAAYNSLYNLLGVLKFAKRHSFIIDPEGRIAAIFMNVDPVSSARQLVTKLTRLMNVSS